MGSIEFVFEQPPVDYEAAYCHKEPGRDPEIEVALRWLHDRRTDDSGRVLVVANTLDTARNSSLVRDLQIESLRTFPKIRIRSQRLVLALWPSSKLLTMVDDTPGLKALAVVPWLLEELDDWRAARRPTDLLGVAEVASEPTIADPVVRRALESLTATVNLGSGLTHPSDKASAIDTFRVLRKAGYSWDPDVVRAWAMAHGWYSHGADDLRRYAAGTLEGRRFQGGRSMLNSDVIEYWRQTAEE